jgi:hypothetical protein
MEINRFTVGLGLKSITICLIGLFCFAFGAEMVHEGPLGVGGFWIFMPDKTQKNPMPVVFFFPGWAASNTINYGNLFDHMTKKGVIVAYIPYMNSMATPFSTFEKNAAKGMAAAQQWLHTHARVDQERIMYAGHSAGAILALDMAARQDLTGLTPNMVFAMEPGKVFINEKKQNGHWTLTQDVPFIPSSVNLVIIHGDKGGYFNDHEMDAQALYDMAVNVPPTRKVICMIHSIDDTEIANHFFPSAANPAYDNGTPVGYHLRRAERVDVTRQRFVKQQERKLKRMSTNDLDLELWAIFDRALKHMSDQTIDANQICRGG